MVLSAEIRKLITENFVYHQLAELKEDESFLDNGILDSTGVPLLVALLEETYGITVQDDELTAANLDSIGRLAMYVERKLGPACSSSGPVLSHPLDPCQSKSKARSS